MLITRIKGIKVTFTQSPTSGIFYGISEKGDSWGITLYDAMYEMSSKIQFG